MEPFWSHCTWFVVARKQRKDTRTMTQEFFPEVKAAIDALQERITLTEAEIAQMKESIATKKQQLKSWRKAVSAVVPQQTNRKKRLVAA